MAATDWHSGIDCGRVATTSNLPDSEMRAREVDHSSSCPKMLIGRPPPILSKFRDWFRRVDKVEFWAGVLLLGYAAVRIAVTGSL